MGGGLMQLVAYGAQDVYLTGNPQITFFKVTYRRHTNFAMESIEQTFNGQADFGRRVTCTISRNGDLAYRTYLQVVLPMVKPDSNGHARWLDFPGEQLVSQVEVEIGGQRIDRQYGDWMHIWNQLTLSKEQERGYNKMIGNTTGLTYITDPNFDDLDTVCNPTHAADQTCVPRNALPETTLYIPLQFWFCRNPGLALPLIALQYHEVKINIDLRPLDQCLWSVNGGLGAQNGDKKDTTNRSLVSASLYVDYVFLDTDERRRMAQNPHEYLIEQLQFTGDESIGSSANKIKLNFNHPCKELVFVVQKDLHVDYCNSTVGGKPGYKLLGAQPFNYTDALDVLPNAFHAFGSQRALSGAGAVVTNNLFQAPGAGGVKATSNWWGAGAAGANNGMFAQNQGQSTGPTPGDSAATSSGDAGLLTWNGSLVSDAGSFVLAETALDMHCWGENPVVTCKLQLNGQDRFSEREGSYFDLVQPYQHHTRAPDTGINVYSFAVRPEEHQPSGSCNFSRIDNATLQLVVSSATVANNETRQGSCLCYQLQCSPHHEWYGWSRLLQLSL